MNWYLKSLKSYAYFAGRACRRKFWFYTLTNTLVIIAINFAYAIALGIGANSMKHKLPHELPPIQGVGAFALAVVISLAFVVYMLGIIIPSIAVTTRRIHDTGRKSWWLLLAPIPVVGVVILLIFLLLGSNPADNRYGPNPKAACS